MPFVDRYTENIEIRIVIQVGGETPDLRAAPVAAPMEGIPQSRGIHLRSCWVAVQGVVRSHTPEDRDWADNTLLVCTPVCILVCSLLVCKEVAEEERSSESRSNQLVVLEAERKVDNSHHCYYDESGGNDVSGVVRDDVRDACLLRFKLPSRCTKSFVSPGNRDGGRRSA